MKTIPFDIKLRKDIQSEENGYKGRYKVQTKSGKPVRIICWDKKEIMYPIVALVEIYDSYEASLLFCNNGKYYTGGDESSYDLCLIDTWEHKFKVGDKVRYRNSDKAVYKIVNVIGSHYVAILSDQSTRFIPFRNDDFLELVPKESERIKRKFRIKRKKIENGLSHGNGMIVNLRYFVDLERLFIPQHLHQKKRLNNILNIRVLW